MRTIASLFLLAVVFLQHANECALSNKIVEQRKEIANLKANVARLQGIV